MDFITKLNKAVDKNNSLLCVGLDADFNKIPIPLKNGALPLFSFNRAIVEATADLVCAYKPNSAFYEALGAEGIAQLQQTTQFIRKNYPHIPIILDVKRADIGNTNNGYIDFAFNYLGVDAMTLHPYLGKEALEPYLTQKDKGLIILCRTSNDGAGEFQDLVIKNRPLYMYVASQVAENWNANNNCLLVVGATYPKEMREIRELVGSEMVFLVPGVGAQGGDVKKLMQAGLGDNKRGLIINSARGIIFASSDKDFAKAARNEAIKLRNEINKYR